MWHVHDLAARLGWAPSNVHAYTVVVCPPVVAVSNVAMGSSLKQDDTVKDQSAAYAPVALFVYNRPDHTQATIDALIGNEGAEHTSLYVFSDGPKNEVDRRNVEAVRRIISDLRGFKQVELIAQEMNRGLANSIISGVTEVVNRHGRVIVFEDDLVSHPGTLRYFNVLLDHYAGNSGVFSISGYNYPATLLAIPERYEYDVYAIPRMQCWGWATWSDRWAKADFSMPDFSRFDASESSTAAYSHWIGADSLNTLRMCMAGKKDVWACRWVYTHFSNHAVCICPIKSYIENIGLDGSGANCGVDKRLRNDLTETRSHKLRIPDQTFIDPEIFEGFMAVVNRRRARAPVSNKSSAFGPSQQSLHPTARPGSFERVAYWVVRPQQFMQRLTALMKNWIANKLNAYSARVHRSVQSKPTVPFVRLGTSYGGWWVPESGLGDTDVVVSAGAGEDISFDIELANRCGCRIIIVDPTPRAVAHYEATKAAVTAGVPAPINNNPEQCYSATAKTFDSIVYRQLGLWDKNSRVEFFPPKNQAHVSHSINNLHETEGGFIADVVTLPELLRRENIQDITVLKMDIEGAEFAVIDSLIGTNIRPRYLMIEFHAGKSKLEQRFKLRTARYLKKLSGCGYRLVQYSGWDYVFERQGI